MPSITLTNPFHNTSCVVRVTPVESEGWMYITPTASQAKKVRRLLCGIKGCTCSQNEMGTRGPQYYRGKPIVFEFSKLHR